VGHDLGVLLPHLADVVVERVSRSADVVEFVARVGGLAAVCPGCGTVSGRVHGRYARRLIDAAIAGASVVISLVVRRFRCEQLVVPR
jgi:transposase